MADGRSLYLILAGLMLRLVIAVCIVTSYIYYQNQSYLTIPINVLY